MSGLRPAQTCGLPYAVKTVLKAWNAKHPDKAVPLPQNHKTVQEGGAD